MFAELLRAAFPILLPAIALAGCYAFVHDDTPPEFTPDPKDVAQQTTAPSAGGSGPGAAIFNGKCSVCHQMNAKGIPGVYPPLSGSAIATGNPELPIRIVLHGFQGPITRNSVNFNGVMAPWQTEFTDEEIAAVLSFVRSNFGNNAPAVDPALVKKIRAATKEKIGAFTEPELKAVLK